MANPVMHFEIAANDVGKLKDFYTGVFGWKIEAVPNMPEYQMVMTAEEGGPGINGGLMKKQSPQQGNCNFVSVPSVVDFAEKVKKLGGQVVVPKTAVPKMGYFIITLDPEGNPIGLWETDEKAA